MQGLGESLDRAPMSSLHLRFWLLAGLGIMLDGFDFFIIGVANPLIAEDLGVSSVEKGLVSAAAIVGAIFGAALFGPLGDKIGRRRIFRVDLWPNATTFALPAEVFPSEVRAAGHGFAAGMGKLGAALGVFLFPVLLADVGESALLFGVAVTSALAFVITYLFQIEPRGRTLDDLAGVDVTAVSPRVTPP